MCVAERSVVQAGVGVGKFLDVWVRRGNFSIYDTYDRLGTVRFTNTFAIKKRTDLGDYNL